VDPTSKGKGRWKERQEKEGRGMEVGRRMFGFP